MRILWHSNAPWCHSGYGEQTRLFVPALQSLGHEVAISTSFGLESGAINWNGIPVYPRLHAHFGHVALPSHAKNFNADVVITLADVWTFSPQLIGPLKRWCPWVPVDCEPLPPQMRELLHLAEPPIVFSRFGERQLTTAGFRPLYVPHAVDTEVFSPGDKAEARKHLGLPNDRFIVGMVAANVSQPSRKAFPQQLAAFARFKRKRSDAILYLHSDPGQTPGIDGVDLLALCAELGLHVGTDVWIPDRYNLCLVGFPTEYMVNAYRAMDVLLSVSSTEAFCIPLIEAQACGTPVITGDWFATGELVFGGWKIPVDQADRFWTPLRVWHYTPRVGAIVETLDIAYKKAGRFHDQARAGALAYDVRRITAEFWEPALTQIREQIETERARPNPCTQHEFSTTATTVNGIRRVPCREPRCDAHRVELGGIWVDREHGMGFEFNGVRLDIEDDPLNGAGKIAMAELPLYDLDAIPFRPGDVVIDVGANVGVVSLYLAKRHPEIKIIAVEPWPESVQRLRRNIAANGATNVTPIACAITDGATAFVDLGLVPGANCGAVSAYVETERKHAAEALTLDALCRIHHIETIRLLKLDCEGAEHEILASANGLLRRVDHLRAEVHVNRRLIDAGRTPQRFAELVQQMRRPEHAKWHVCEIG